MSSDGSIPKVKATHGRVISADIGDWSGRLAGPILVELETEERIELRYDSSSQGPIPEVGDIVRVQYTGESIFHITLIERISGPRRKKEFEEVPPSQLTSLSEKPPCVLILSSVLVITGILEIILGFVGSFPSQFAYNNRMTFIILGIFQIFFGIFLTMNSD